MDDKWLENSQRSVIKKQNQKYLALNGPSISQKEKRVTNAGNGSTLLINKNDDRFLFSVCVFEIRHFGNGIFTDCVILSFAPLLSGTI